MIHILLLVKTLNFVINVCIIIKIIWRKNAYLAKNDAAAEGLPVGEPGDDIRDMEGGGDE